MYGTKTLDRWKEHKLTERPKVIYEYHATGKGSFPFDMLRHDACWPASGDDAAKLDNHKQLRLLRSVRLRSYVQPTIDRWSSFGWSVGLHNLYDQGERG